MAAYSLLSTLFLQSPSPSSPFARPPNRTPKLHPLSFTSTSKSSSSLLPTNKLSLSSLHSLIFNKSKNNTNNSCFVSSALDSFFILCTSLALSLSLFVTDAGPASAFVVTTPRKLPSDELATVRLFQDNTPSVVYITNLAVRFVQFSLFWVFYFILLNLLLGSFYFPVFKFFFFFLGNGFLGRMLLHWMCWRYRKDPGRVSFGITLVTLSPIIM